MKLPIKIMLLSILILVVTFVFAKPASAVDVICEVDEVLGIDRDASWKLDPAIWKVVEEPDLITVTPVQDPTNLYCGVHVNGQPLQKVVLDGLDILFIKSIGPISTHVKVMDNAALRYVDIDSSGHQIYNSLIVGSSEIDHVDITDAYASTLSLSLSSAYDGSITGGSMGPIVGAGSLLKGYTLSDQSARAMYFHGGTVAMPGRAQDIIVDNAGTNAIFLYTNAVAELDNSKVNTTKEAFFTREFSHLTVTNSNIIGSSVGFIIRGSAVIDNTDITAVEKGIDAEGPSVVIMTGGSITSPGTIFRAMKPDIDGVNAVATFTDVAFDGSTGSLVEAGQSAKITIIENDPAKIMTAKMLTNETYGIGMYGISGSYGGGMYGGYAKISGTPGGTYGSRYDGTYGSAVAEYRYVDPSEPAGHLKSIFTHEEPSGTVGLSKEMRAMATERCMHTTPDDDALGQVAVALMRETVDGDVEIEGTKGLGDLSVTIDKDLVLDDLTSRAMFATQFDYYLTAKANEISGDIIAHDDLLDNIEMAVTATSKIDPLLVDTYTIAIDKTPDAYLDDEEKDSLMRQSTAFIGGMDLQFQKELLLAEPVKSANSLELTTLRENPLDAVAKVKGEADVMAKELVVKDVKAAKQLKKDVTKALTMVSAKELLAKEKVKITKASPATVEIFDETNTRKAMLTFEDPIALRISQIPLEAHLAYIALAFQEVKAERLLSLKATGDEFEYKQFIINDLVEFPVDVAGLDPEDGKAALKQAIDELAVPKIDIPVECKQFDQLACHIDTEFILADWYCYHKEGRTIDECTVDSTIGGTVYDGKLHAIVKAVQPEEGKVKHIVRAVFTSGNYKDHMLIVWPNNTAPGVVKITQSANQ